MWGKFVGRSFSAQGQELVVLGGDLGFEGFLVGCQWYLRGFVVVERQPKDLEFLATGGATEGGGADGSDLHGAG